MRDMMAGLGASGVLAKIPGGRLAGAGGSIRAAGGGARAEATATLARQKRPLAERDKRKQGANPARRIVAATPRGRGRQDRKAK